MDNNIVHQLVYSMVQFLRSQLEASDSLSEEGIESVEVAVQCLETAYNLFPNSELSTNRSLYDIFAEAATIQGTICESMNVVVTETVREEATEEQKGEAEQLKNEGNLLMREEKFSEALECYTKAIGKDGRNAVYYCNRAAAYSKLNNHSEAIEDCRRALDIEPQYSKAYGRMGLAYSSLNKHSKAKDCYEKALQLEPENESYRSNLTIAEETIKTEPALPANPFPGLGGLGGLAGLAGSVGTSGAPDLSGLLNNPALMNMATQLMTDPNMQNMMTNILGSIGGTGGGGSNTPPAETAPPPSISSSTLPTSLSTPATPPVSGTAPAGPGMDALLSAGLQLAEQMQNQHPEVVERLRAQISRPSDTNNDSESQDPPPPSSQS